MKSHSKIFVFTILELWRSNIFNKVNGYFEEINGYKYLTLVPNNENKEKIKKIVD